MKNYKTFESAMTDTLHAYEDLISDPLKHSNFDKKLATKNTKVCEPLIHERFTLHSRLQSSFVNAFTKVLLPVRSGPKKYIMPMKIVSP